MTSPVPDNIHDFIGLYASQFPELRFPELDLTVLEQGVRGVESAQGRVAEAEAALEAARADLNEAMTELSHKAYRALSFLKLYAQDDEEALARLDAVVLARPTRRLPDGSCTVGALRRRRSSCAVRQAVSAPA